MALHFELVTPDKLVRSEDVHMVVVPGTEGEFGVLEGHAPFMSTIRDGAVQVYRTEGAAAGERRGPRRICRSRRERPHRAGGAHRGLIFHLSEHEKGARRGALFRFGLALPLPVVNHKPTQALEWNRGILRAQRLALPYLP